MGKIAFMFPGQGVQKLGMGKDFYEGSDIAKKVYDVASEASGLDVKKLCFEENEMLNITEYTQIALLTTEVAILRCMLDKGYKPDYCIGLSLGEYGALAASNVMSDSDLFRLIRKRGLFMQEEYPSGGAMMAVLALDADNIAKVLDRVDGLVSIANDNCPGQVVITGEKAAVEKAGILLKEAGAKRCLPLNVSGPFHSELIKGAGLKLKELLDEITIEDPIYPYIANVSAELVTDKSEIKELLSSQVYKGVRFREGILKLKDLSVTKFVEIGPGKTLSGFVNKIDADLSTYKVGTYEEFNMLDSFLENN